MAPRKEDSKKSKTDDGADIVLDYLRKQNRPYSAIDISSNLHNRVTKASAAKHLKDLHDRKQIEGRVSGKQIVYHTLQPELSPSISKDLGVLEQKLSQLRESFSRLKHQEKNVKAELTSIANFQSVDQLSSTIDALERQKSALMNEIAKFKRMDVKPVSGTQRQELEAELSKLKAQVVARKRIALELWSYVWEIYCNQPAECEKLTKEELWLDEIGGEGSIPSKRLAA